MLLHLHIERAWLVPLLFFPYSCSHRETEMGRVTSNREELVLFCVSGITLLLMFLVVGCEVRFWSACSVVVQSPTFPRAPGSRAKQRSSLRRERGREEKCRRGNSSSIQPLPPSSFLLLLTDASASIYNSNTHTWKYSRNAAIFFFL